MFYCGDQIKENEMGRTCCIHGRGNICAQDFACEQREKKIETKFKISLKFIPKK
jgi:hypothetical protein